MTTPKVPSSSGRVPRRLLAVLAIAIGGVAGLLVMIALDRAYGLMRSPEPAAAAAPGGLIYRPGERIRHVTPEFAYSATINSLGFRGPEPGDGAHRILAVGDSWVYGWGVDEDAHWLVLLQDSLRLRLSAPALEILNLGAPGTSPSGYAAIAERAIHQLRPKLVLVGVLQGQDFAQTWWETQRPGERFGTVAMREVPAMVRRKGGGVLARLFPNFSSLLHSRRLEAAPAAGTAHDDSTLAEGAAAARRDQAAGIERTFTGAARARFDSLSPEIRDAFRRGHFNPIELYYALRQPDYFHMTTALESPRGREVLAGMGRQLQRIRAAADAVGARTIAVSMPHGAYTSRDMCASCRAFGYRCDDLLLRTPAADEAIVRAARAAGIDTVVVVTADFRAAADSAAPPFFFRLDGHLTREGNRAYAALLAPRLAPLVEAALGGGEGDTDAR